MANQASRPPIEEEEFGMTCNPFRRFLHLPKSLLALHHITTMFKGMRRSIRMEELSKRGGANL
jgi:hypothetical protein